MNFRDTLKFGAATLWEFVRVVAVSGNSLMSRPKAPSGECRIEVGLATMQFGRGRSIFKEDARA